MVVLNVSPHVSRAGVVVCDVLHFHDSLIPYVGSHQRRGIVIYDDHWSR